MTAIRDDIMGLPVFDTHTHLESGYRQSTLGLYARNFVDICRYFWFQRELEAVGFKPRGKDDVDIEVSSQEAKVLHDALCQIRNTYWTRTVMQAMDDLYGIRPDRVDRILELSAKMAENKSNPDWGIQVCDKIGIKKTVMGPGGTPEGTTLDADVDLIEERVVRVPAYDLTTCFADFDDSTLHLKVDELKQRIKADVDGFRDAGYRVVRAAWPFINDNDKAVRKDFTQDELRDKQNLQQYLGHYLFGLFEEHGFNLQIFFGMVRPKVVGLSDLSLVRAYAQNDTTYVSVMHNIFEMYMGIDFELFCATELNSLDMVQAARIYPNVYPGGLWWFNFRRSVYEKNMQYRVEALPASRATFVASDARCIEWSYIKISLIKKVMGQFFEKQIKEGWLDEDAALYTARHWLHDTAAKLYA